jgi:hypothetical protein
LRRSSETARAHAETAGGSMEHGRYDTRSGDRSRSSSPQSPRGQESRGESLGKSDKLSFGISAILSDSVGPKYSSSQNIGQNLCYIDSVSGSSPSVSPNIASVSSKFPPMAFSALPYSLTVNGVLRVPAHRPAPLGTMSIPYGHALMFPWMEARRDRLTGKDTWHARHLGTSTLTGCKR